MAYEQKRIIGQGKRAALYARVSTEEQAMHGVSLEAQRERLVSYAKENSLEIVGIYIDEGISARKKYTSRQEFMRMLGDVKNGLVDIILFIKLDRWFRNIADYYEVQRLLDTHGVSWLATEEEYDTTTANGRLALNIKLAIAQDESDRTSERIRFVFANMVKDGKVISGQVPMGFKIENKCMVIDEQEAPTVRRIFECYIDSRSLAATARALRAELGRAIDPKTVGRIISNKKYIGEAYGINGWCPAIIDEDTFDLANSILTRRTERSSGRSDRIYLFSGLLFCAVCGKRLSAYARPVINGYGEKRDFIYYRCPSRVRGACSMKKQINEEYLEDALVEAAELQAIKPYEKKAHTDSAAEISEIRKRLERLKELYLWELVDKQSYEKDYVALNERLRALISANSAPQEAGSDSEALSEYYHRLDKKEKKAFWSRSLERAEINACGEARIFFYQSKRTQPSGTATTITVSPSIKARKRF